MSTTGKYTYEELRYLYRRAKQWATTMDLGIPIEEEGLSQQELWDLVDELQRTEDWTIKSRILTVLNYAGIQDVEAVKDVIATFLAGPDSWLAFKALEILCQDWGLTSEYLEQIRTHIRGVPWDHNSSCQETALSMAGEYLSKRGRAHLSEQGDLMLVQEIVQLYEREGSTPRERAEALYALGYEGEGEDEDIAGLEVVRKAKALLETTPPHPAPQ